MENANTKPYYDYNYYSQMGYYPPPATEQKSSDVNVDPRLNNQEAAKSSSASNTTTTIISSTNTEASTQPYVYSAAEMQAAQQYYNYYANYPGYYEYYQYYNYYNTTANSAPIPPATSTVSTKPPLPDSTLSTSTPALPSSEENEAKPSTNNSTEAINNSNETTNQLPNTEGAVNKPLHQSYPQLYYPPPINYSVPPPWYATQNTQNTQNKQNFWNHTYGNQYKTETVQQTPQVTPSANTINVVKPKLSTRPSRFQSQSSQKTEKPKSYPPKEEKPTPTKTTVWPEALKSYVQRSFNSVDEKDKDKMQDLLKEKLEIVYSKDMVNKIDWSKEPILKIPMSPSTLNSSITKSGSAHHSSSANQNSKKSYGLQKPRVFSPPSVSRSSNSASVDQSTRSSSRRIFMGGRNTFNNRATSRSSSRSNDSRRRRSHRHRTRKRSRSESVVSMRSDRQSSPRDDSSHNDTSREYIGSGAGGGTGGLPSRKYRKYSSESDHKSDHYSDAEKSFESERIVKQQAPTAMMSGGALNITVGNKKGRNKKRIVNKKPKTRFQNNNINNFEEKITVEKFGFEKFTNEKFCNEKLANRASRFKEHLLKTAVASTDNFDVTDRGATIEDLNNVTWSNFKIVGTCQDLEKKYLRLTRAPEPSEVRPIEVLRNSLEHVRKLWYEDRIDYRHICEQFKSIRQDLTVQCIRDDFTLSVYKVHATVALEANDHEEFNQCQSQIKLLYEEGLACPDYLEFTAYRLIYYMFTRDFLNIGTTLASLQDHHKQHQCLSFALQLRAAWSTNNFCRFFRLACSDLAPKLCSKIIKWFLDRERKAALKSIIKSYRPHLELSYLSNLLGFSDTEQCKTFLTGMLATTTASDQVANTAATTTLMDLLVIGTDSIGDKLDMKLCATAFQM